jgi:hypothetical protein
MAFLTELKARKLITAIVLAGISVGLFLGYMALTWYTVR